MPPLTPGTDVAPLAAMNEPTEQPARPNAVEGNTLILGDLTFTFTNTPTAPNEVQIGATAEETDRNLHAAIQASAEYVPAGLIAMAAPAEPTEPANPPAPPTFEEWFQRVEKWAQFHAVPIPGPTDALRYEYDLGTAPAEAAKKHCPFPSM